LHTWDIFRTFVYMKEHVTDIEKVMRELKSEMSSLRRTVSEQGTEISRLNRLAAALRVEIHDLKLRNVELEKENAALKQENAELKQKLGDMDKPEKDSHNSSVPPSQEPIASKELRRTKSLRKRSGKKSGGQPGHKGCTLDWESEPDTTIEHNPCYCQHCGKSLENVPVTKSQRTQVFDVEMPKVTATEHQYNEKICSCGHHNRIDAPNCPVTYGKNLRAIVVYLAHVQCLPFGRIAETLSDFFNHKISEGTIRNILKDVGKKADFAYNEIHDRIEKSPVVGADETGAHVKKENHWDWIFQTELLTYVFHQKSREMTAIDSQFPDGLPQAILVTDRLGCYFNMRVKKHQVCLAHLLRNAEYLNELDESQTWSGRFIRYLMNAINMRREESVTTRKIKILHTKMDKLLNESLNHLDEEFEKFRRGIRKVKDYLFTFLEDFSVPYDNNASERGIRKIKIKQKISGCFRSGDGADIFAKVHSIVETAKKNGNSKFNAILAMYF
jgi:transposase